MKQEDIDFDGCLDIDDLGRAAKFLTYMLNDVMNRCPLPGAHMHMPSDLTEYIQGVAKWEKYCRENSDDSEIPDRVTH